MKIVHAADLHLDSPMRGLERYEGAPLDEMRGATRRALQNLVALAIEQAVDFVLVVGDLYDGDWRDFGTGLFFNACMSELNQAGIAVYVLAGNHDAASQITRRLRPPPNVAFFAVDRAETVTLDALGVALHGQGFATRAVTEDLSLRYPAPVAGVCNIGALHTSLDGRPGHEPYAPCTLEGLRNKGYAYWALGHVHRREIVSREPWVVFPGNLQGRHAGEPGAKGASIVSIEDGRVSAVEHHALDVVRWFCESVEVSGAVSVDEVLALIETHLEAIASRADGRLAAVRLSLEGDCAVSDRLRVEQTRLLAECRSLATSTGRVWMEKIELKTRGLDALEDALTRDDALGALLRALRDVEASPESLLASAGLDELRARIPAALMVADGDENPPGTERLEAVLADVKALLLDRLLAESSGR